MLDNDNLRPLKVARDITEQNLAKYSDKGYKIMWETDLGIVSGWFEHHRDSNFIAEHAYLFKGYPFKEMRYVGDLDVPDDTVVAIVDFEKSNKGRMVKWGVTSFDSEDSAVVGKS